MEINVVLEKQEEGGYTAYIPSLPGCVSQGETKEEAIVNIREAIALYLEPDENELIMYRKQAEISKIMMSRILPNRAL